MLLIISLHAFKFQLIFLMISQFSINSSLYFASDAFIAMSEARRGKAPVEYERAHSKAHPHSMALKWCVRMAVGVWKCVINAHFVNKYVLSARSNRFYWKSAFRISMLPFYQMKLNEIIPRAQFIYL